MPQSALFDHLPALINRVKRLAVDAGELTLDYFDEGGMMDNVMHKEDGSPLTKADQAAEDLITAGLKDIDESVPIIGEEAAAAGKLPELGDNAYFWLVDPLDGTKEFISGSGDYTVNIALIKNGQPLLGIVYAPFHGELYSGIVGLGAWRWLDDTDHEKDIRTRKAPKEGLSIVASKSHGSGEKLDQFLEGFKINKLIKRGSSLKICAVAAGKADIYPRFGPTCQWDTAAADAVLRAAGGMITDEAGKPLTYGQGAPKYMNPEFICWSGDLMPS